MGHLTKPGLDDILAGGCACGSVKLEFTTYVDGRFTLLSGNQFGAVVWAYKGETFVDGVFEITCVACKKVLFTSDMCPRCNGPHALAGILASQSTFVIPERCPRCDAETLLYTAMVPATVMYEGKRAQKARACIDLVEEGAHGVRLDCKRCGILEEVLGTCPLCHAPGPLRERPD